VGTFASYIQKRGIYLNQLLKKNRIISNLYLVVKFRLSILKTKIYLVKLNIRKKDLPISLNIKNYLKFPEFDSKITNPSITYSDNRIFGVARISNANYEEFADYAGRPVQLYKQQGHPFLNGIVKFNSDIFGNVSNFEVVHTLSKIPNYEDPRIFIFKGKKLLIMTYITNSPEKMGIWQSSIAVGDIDSGNTQILTSPEKRNIEKNWVPIEDNESLRFLYSSNPISVIELQMKTGEMKYSKTELNSRIYLHNRTQVIRTNHPSIPYLRIASAKFAHHKVGYTPFHYFEILSEKLEPIKISRPFVFTAIQMEICQGITLDGSTLIISWTEKEKINMIGTIDIDSIINLFN
jgi:hypothetical protein